MATDIKIKEIKNADIDVDVTSVRNIDPVTLTPVTVERIENIAPAAVHIKELNHIDPLSIESLRINEVSNLDPLKIEQLNVTHLPTVALSLSQLPALDLNLRRVPPVAIGLQQDFCLPSRYSVQAKVLGFKIMQLEIDGLTMLKPRDRTRREQSRTHERSFADVAPVGNPAIPTDVTEKKAEAVTTAVPAYRAAPGSVCVSRARPPRASGHYGPPPVGSAGHAQGALHSAGLKAGTPRDHYSLSSTSATESSVESGD
ncbi:MAG: hypothetical protein GY947_05290 [Rhodobacteraceae bacterium]|nr:hypothetical protein [Paracoccaceae bacterium]